jgi:hypothetical protein
MLGSIKVTFTPAAPSAANSTITVTTTPLHADGTMSGSVKIHLADNAGNPDACLPIFLDQANAHSTVTALPVPTAMQAEGCMDADGNSLYLADDDHQVHTDKNGDAEFTATDTVAEDVLFTAHIGTFLLPATDPMHFIAGVWDAQNSSTELDLASAPADGKTKATVTVTLRDAHQNPLSGTAVTLTPTGSSTAVITPGATLTTQSDGTAVFTVADNTAHAITLTATDAAGTVIGQVLNLAFTGHAIPACTTPDPLKCSQVSADTFHAPVGSLITVHATVRDQVGSAISG